MSQQQVAQLLSKLLGNVAKYSVVAGVGVTALQSSLYTGCSISLSNRPLRNRMLMCCIAVFADQRNVLKVRTCLHLLSRCCLHAVDGGERAVMYDRISGERIRRASPQTCSYRTAFTPSRLLASSFSLCISWLFKVEFSSRFEYSFWHRQMVPCRGASRPYWRGHPLQSTLASDAQHHGHQNKAPHHKLSDWNKRFAEHCKPQMLTVPQD